MHQQKITAAILAILTLVTCFTLSHRESASRILAELAPPLLRRELGITFDGERFSPAAMLVLRQSPLLCALLDTPQQEAADIVLSQPDESPSRENSSDTAAENPDNGVPSQTVIPANPAGYTLVNGVYIKNASAKSLDARLLAAAAYPHAGAPSPQVLIVHTHGSEAYTMPSGQEYTSTGTYRTSDCSCNVVRVGDEIAAVLSSYGIGVMHDRTLYDDPLYDGAYERSAEGIAAYLEKYPSIAFVLDIHRDAVQDASGQQYKLITKENPDCAQISLIMGSNNDHWQENLALAVAVSGAISEQSPTAMRPITLRNANYNEHLTSGSMLVEIGAAGNSLNEALNAARLFAVGFAAAIK